MSSETLITIALLLATTPTPRGEAAATRTTAVDVAVEPDGRAPIDVAAALETGWHRLHDVDYEGARWAFRAMQRHAPDDPRGYLYEAVVVWLRELERRHELDVTRFIDARHFAKEDARPVNPEAETRVHRLLDRARELSTGRLAANPDDVDALYWSGMSFGIEAGFRSTVLHETNAALSAARRAVREQRRVIEKDPEYWDAYLTLGLWEYATGSLPFYVKWVAVLAGIRGDKDEGVRLMELAAAKGQTAARDAKVMLTVVYVREERLDDALLLLDELRRAAPRNHVLRLNAGHSLFQLGRYTEAAASYAEAVRTARPEAGFDRASVRLQEARALLHGGLVERALAIATTVLADVGLAAEVHTRARLVAGQCHDALGQRTEAVAHYLRVARDDDPAEARKAALGYLERRFEGHAGRPPASPSPPTSR